MERRFSRLFAALLVLLLTPAAAVSQTRASVDIPYQKFVLDNGLTLIVHEDHKAPIVAVNVWYHVGSKNEKPGKTGFAHLFEHLMFNGSENHDDDYFQPLERVGATDLNGTTSMDRTNYFQNVPTSALDLALWLESDRMGHLLGAVTQAKLDEQRGVVQNEKRQGENQPYGRVWNTIFENVFPKGHPYSWPVIGSMEDLDAATLEDVHEWFRTYYGPNNAVLVVAGDVDTEEVRRKVEHYFGDIPPGPPIAKQQSWIAKRTGEQRARMEDRVPQARIYKVWNIPGWATAEADQLTLVGNVLSSGKTSRLYKRLVYDEQIATDVSAYVYGAEIAGLFVMVATVRPGGDIAAVERAMDEEMARFLAEGPTPRELERVKAQWRSSFIRGVERIGGFGGKSDVLAQGEVFAGRPDHYKVREERIAAATPETLRQVAREWLSDGVFVLEVHPYPQQLKAASAGADRSRLPEVGTPPVAEFPEIQTATLSNGLKIVLAERHSVPVVQFRLLVDAGYAADPPGAPGTASLAMNMLDEGTKRRNALEISEELARLGATLSTGADLDMSMVYFSALRENLDASLELFADVVLNPAFPEADFERLKNQQIAAIQREKVSPVSIALRVFPRLLYGEGHAYGKPLTGSGTEESVRALTRADLERYHRTWFKPNNATLVVVGATSLDEIRPKLERLFRDWKPGDVPKKNIGRVEHKDRSVVYLIDRPGSQQSIIFAGHIIPPKANPRELAFELLNDALGGNFTSRINMNLREDKHWSYGAFTIAYDAEGQRPFIVYAPVQTDKTKESMVEVLAELRGIVGDRPLTQDELSLVKSQRTLSMPGSWETMSAVASSISSLVRFGLPLDHYRTLADRIRATTLDEASGVAREFIHPDRLVWVVVGDRARIEAGIRELGLGEIRFLDADGNPLGERTALR